MKNIWFYIIFLQVASGSALQKEASLTQKTSTQQIFKQTSPILETKASYLFFASSNMSKVYRDGGFQVQLSGSCPIWRGLQVYGNIGFSEAWGKSLSFRQHTSLWQISVDLGLKPILTVASFAQYYFAVGPRYFYIHQRNSSSYVNPTVTKSGVGLFVNTGFNLFPISHLVINIFGEYAYEPVHFSPSRSNVYGKGIQLSFFSVGAGIGYTF
jgi:hypothetical protein